MVTLAPAVAASVQSVMKTFTIAAAGSSATPAVVARLSAMAVLTSRCSGFLLVATGSSITMEGM